MNCVLERMLYSLYIYWPSYSSCLNALIVTVCSIHLVEVAADKKDACGSRLPAAYECCHVQCTIVRHAAIYRQTRVERII